MAVVRVNEKFDERFGSGDYKATREYLRKFQVITSNLTDDAITVSAAIGIPRIFDPYIGSDGLIDPLGALCTKVEPRNVGEFEWMVRCYYSNRCDWPNLGDLNPLLRPSVVSWSTVEAVRVATRDQNGKAYLNSAGEKFKPGREVDDSRLQLTIKRIQASYDPNLGQQYHGAVNSDVFFGAQPGYCKASISGENHYENNVMYQDVTYVFLFKNPAREGWQPLILDEGFSYIDPATGKLTPFFDKLHGQPFSVPQLLDGQGGDLHAANVPLVAGGMAVADTVMAPQTSPAWLSNATFPITVTIDAEQLIVTGTNPARAGQYLVTRAANGTTAANHAGAATVQLGPVYLSFAEHPALPFAALHVP